MSLMFTALLLAGSALADSDQGTRKHGKTIHPYQTTHFFTTVADGSTRHTRRFSSREDVYVHAVSAHRIHTTIRHEKNYTSHDNDRWQDGDYVYQVTEPSGRILLSSDPASCRIVRIEDGAIKTLRKPKSSWILVDRSADDDCNTKNDPDGLSGNSKHHDTNRDLLGRAPAIAVQLMPFVMTPDREGYHRLWMIPLNTYKKSGGDMAASPQPICRASTHSTNCSTSQSSIGFVPDNGFSDKLKTRSLLFRIEDSMKLAPMAEAEHKLPKVAQFRDNNR